ncbi:hypothetical protein N9544_00620 [Flavobacteriales bacterium]|nr:hypothetical protein [Flavobacteriales bacterium]
MKNKAIISFLCFAVSTISYSQSKSLLKNKLAIVYDLSYSPKSYIDENSGLAEIGIRETIKRTNFIHSVTFNYKLMSKLSLSLIGGYHSNNITGISNNYYYSQPGDETPKINSFSYGAGINLFFKKGLSPSDSHLGIYYKKNSYKINQDDVVEALYGNYFTETKTTIFNLKASDDLTLDLSMIGVKYVYTRMITKNLPIYWNIGVHYLIPISNKKTYSEIDYEEESYNSFEPNFSNDQIVALDYYKSLHVFRINLGLGYIF